MNVIALAIIATTWLLASFVHAINTDIDPDHPRAGRYVFCDVSGGITDQMRSIQGCVYLAMLLQRTLVAPCVNLSLGGNQAPFHQLFDFESLSSHAKWHSVDVLTVSKFNAIITKSNPGQQLRCNNSYDRKPTPQLWIDLHAYESHKGWDAHYNASVEHIEACVPDGLRCERQMLQSFGRSSRWSNASLLHFGSPIRFSPFVNNTLVLRYAPVLVKLAQKARKLLLAKFGSFDCVHARVEKDWLGAACRDAGESIIQISKTQHEAGLCGNSRGPFPPCHYDADEEWHPKFLTPDDIARALNVSVVSSQPVYVVTGAVPHMLSALLLRLRQSFPQVLTKHSLFPALRMSNQLREAMETISYRGAVFDQHVCVGASAVHTTKNSGWSSSFKSIAKSNIVKVRAMLDDLCRTTK